MPFPRLAAATAIALMLASCSTTETSGTEPGGRTRTAEAERIPDSLRPDYDRQAAREIVAILGKEIAVYLVDGAGTPDVARAGDTLQLVGESLAEPLALYKLTPNEAHFIVDGVQYGEGSRHYSWCVSLTNPDAPDGYPETYSYSALLGLLEEPCPEF